MIGGGGGGGACPPALMTDGSEKPMPNRVKVWKFWEKIAKIKLPF